jgi:hypothetical protein
MIKALVISCVALGTVVSGAALARTSAVLSPENPFFGLTKSRGQQTTPYQRNRPSYRAAPAQHNNVDID